jgi:ABC-type Na+ efflux pump permease subunit
VIEMIRRFLRQKSRSVGTLSVLGLFAAASAFSIAASGGRGSLGSSGYLILLVLGAASVSKDASTGALQMILARPIRRTDYLFGRYLGILCGFAAFMAACAALGVSVKMAWKPDGPALAPLAVLANMGYGTLWAAQIAAVLVFFSTFLPGYGDAIALVALEVLLSLQTNAAWIQKPVEAIRRELLPVVPWERVFDGDPAALSVAGRAVLASALYLAAAAVIFARREFAYGQD